MQNFIEACHEKLCSTSRLHANGECRVWTGNCNKGYGQFRYRDPRDAPASGHRTRGAHRIALMVKFRDFDVPASLQASHLCNNRLCVNTDHLNFEDNYTNNSRKGCFFRGICTGHVDVSGIEQPSCILHLKTNGNGKCSLKLHVCSRALGKNILLTPALSVTGVEHVLC